MDDTTNLVALVVLITFAAIGITRTVQKLRGRSARNGNNHLDMQNQNRGNRPDWQN